MRRWAMVDRLVRVRVGEKEDRLFAPLTRRVDRVVVGRLGSAGQLHRADGSAFQLKQIAVTVRSKLQNDCRELQARCIAGAACEVASDCSPSPVEGLSEFFQRVGIVGDAAAVRCVVHDRTPFPALGQEWGLLAARSTRARGRPQNS